MTKNFNILVNKLNSFKFKYYGYKIVKGFILTLLILLALYTSFSVIEYFVYLSSEIRKILFYGFSIFSVLLTIQYIVVPVLKLLHILRPIDTKSSTNLIQSHFSEIQDKLLNIIELASISESKYSNEIILASIDQKIDEIKLFDFNDAVQFKNLRFIFLYLAISLITMAGIFIANKNIFTESTNRIVHYNAEFIKPAPYTFQLVNTELKAKKGDLFSVKVKCEGTELPQLVYINIEGNNYLMKSVDVGSFEFEISSVINSFEFYFTDLKHNSEKYTLQLLPNPGIIDFNVDITPPAYTQLKKQTFKNVGDIQVPHGTKVEWTFTGIDVDSLTILLQDSTKIISIGNNNIFKAEKHFYKASKYNVYVKNIISEPELALSYSIDVFPDMFPEIEVNQINDSLKLARFYFKGIIGDDYGFSDLSFHFNVNNIDSAISLNVVKSLSDQEFYFGFDFSELELKSGVVSYYFSVSDNDVINNYKTTTSDNFIFEIPNKEDISAFEKEQFNELQNMLNQSQKLTDEIKKDLKNLQLKNMDTNISEWEKTQMVKDIVSKQNDLEKLYDQIKQDNEKLNNYLNSFNKQNDDIIEKQKQIEALMEEIFTDELKKLMEEFNKLAEKFDSKKLNQLSKQMDLSFEDLQKQLDRNLEMLRKMKMEEQIQNIIDDVNTMANEEEKLADEIIEEKNYEETHEKVSEHQKSLKDLEDQIKEISELNSELEKPMNFDDFDEEFEDVNQSMEKSKGELQNKNRKKSGSGIKQTSEKLKNLAFGMQQMLETNTMEQDMENIEKLKQILSNLMFLSFEQEEVLVQLSNINSADPLLSKLNKQQQQIINQSQIIKDSLYALAFRTPQINSMVNNELLVIDRELLKASEQMEEAMFSNARVSQQFVITSVNNLALMLNEALENLEKQMANAMKGDQECEKPGNGKPGMSMMKKASENIKEQLQQMLDQMKKGNSQQLSQQLGESLMQHEMMQQMLRDLMNNGSVGSSAKKTMQEIDNMLEQNRKELMNKNINAQTIARQNLITTRLLEAEKAELEREFEDKRESESADEFYSNPVKFFEYKEKDNYSIEYLNKNSHQLSNFYNYKYKQYLNKIQK